MPIETGASFGLKSLESREGRSIMAEAILSEKNRLLQAEGVHQDYQEEILYSDGEYSFTDPQKISETTEDLVSTINAYSKVYLENHSETSFVRLNAAVVALAEIRILGPKTLYSSQKQQVEGQVRRVGIQKEQVEAALAIESMDSAEVPSSQGKSNTDIPIAAVARAYLTGEQIHIMVRDPQAKKRDAENIRLLTSALDLNLGVIDRTELKSQARKRIKDLVFMSDVIDFAAGLSRGEKEEFKRQRRKEIDQLIKEVNFSLMSDEDQSPVFTDDKGKKDTDIIIGDDKDFVFTSMTDKRKFVWGEKKACVICDEGDLPWTKGSGYEQEDEGLSPLSGYLPEWVTSCVVDEVCTAMRKEGKITPDANNQFDFIDALGDETLVEYDQRIRLRLELVAKDGTLQDRYMQTLRNKIAGEFEGLMKTIPLQSYSKKLRERKAKYFFTYDSMRKLVKRYAYQDVSPPVEAENLDILHPADSIAFYDHAWLTAQKLTTGQNYSLSDSGIVIIDQETGHPLPTHQYSGLVDMAVDVKEGICSLRSRTDAIRDRTGFQMFLQRNYGKGRVSLVSATLDHIRDEVQEFTGGRVVDIGYWIGREMPIPQAEISEDFARAKNRLLTLIQEASIAGRPVEIVCDDDEELGVLKQFFEEWNKEAEKYQVNVVTSRSGLDHEETVFGQAGQLNTLTLTNPRGGRMVDIKSSPETNNAGGLLLVVWGALKNKAVLKQVLARTARTGAPGETRWMVYKYGGKAALENNHTVKRYPKNIEALASLQDGQRLDYDYSLLESIHQRNNLEDQTLRLLTYAYDELRFSMYSEARQSLEQAIGDIATQGYIKEYIKIRWNDMIDFIADDYISHLSRYRMDSIGDLSVARGLVMGETIMRRMADNYSGIVLVDSKDLYFQHPVSGRGHLISTSHRKRLLPDKATFLRFKDFSVVDTSGQTHFLGEMPREDSDKNVSAGIYFPQSPHKLYLLTRSVNPLSGSQAKASSDAGYSLRIMSFDDKDRFDGDKVFTVSESDIEELLGHAFYPEDALKQKALFSQIRKLGILPA